MSHLIDKSVFQPSIKLLVKNFTWRCIYLRLSKVIKCSQLVC